MLGDEPISVPPEPGGERTRLTLTEQGARLDAFDDPATRERGTRDLLEALAAYVAPARAR